MVQAFFIKSRIQSPEQLILLRALAFRYHSFETMVKASVEHTSIDVNGTIVPARIYREMRRSVRFSLARKGAILRLPLLMPPQDQHRELGG